jgi:hypothetical protein
MSNTVSRAPRRNRQFWIDHVKRWRNSGLSKAAYCEQHTLKPGSFYNWSTQIDSELASDLRTTSGEPVDVTAIQFHPVKLAPSEASDQQFVHVERAATDVALPSDLTPEQIHHWLSAIHQLHV